MLRELVVERFRGVRSARLGFDRTTVLIGENDCGTSSLLEAMALVLLPPGRPPVVQPWQFHDDSVAVADAPMRIRLTFGESHAGSWDRPGLEALRPLIGTAGGRPRTLVVELVAFPLASGEPSPASFQVRSPQSRASRDDLAVLDAVRRINPLVWLQRGVLAGPSHPAAAGPASDVLPEATEVLQRYVQLLSGAAPEEREIESGYAAAQELLAQWAPVARDRGPGARAAVAEILGRALEPAGSAAPKAPPRGPIAQKLGVFLLTARLFEGLRPGSAPGIRPIIVIEEPESGLHTMTLASVWSLLERLDTQKIVTTHSGTLLSAAPLRSVRRLVRDTEGAVREWRVREGTLSKGDLRKVSYHLRARRSAACFGRCWLLVEGETEYWLLPDLARLLGHDLVQEGVACVEFAQSGLAPLVKLARALGIEWHVLADGDRAGHDYEEVARSLMDRDQEELRLTVLRERDVEHCFWRNGHAHVFERLARLPADAHAPPRRVIEKAIERRSKPGVAFELLAAVAAAGATSVPASLRRAIEICVGLARDGGARATGRE